MKTTLLVLAIAFAGTALPAGEAIRTFAWTDPTNTPTAPGTSRVMADGRAALRIENTNTTALQATLLRIERPLAEFRAYAVRGEVKYDAVQGDGFLEMWSEFPPVREGASPGRYFSRTLGVSGPMGRLTGTSSWRPFELPFDPTGAPGAPTRLEINLHLPGRGTVHVGPLTLVQYSGTSLSGGFGGRPDGWWSDRLAGIFGGLAGAVIGCLASVVAHCANRGRAHGFVVAAMVGLTVLGSVALAGALVALAVRQPIHVWGSLLLLGAILVTTIPFRLRQYRRLYAELELRRMTAADALNAGS